MELSELLKTKVGLEQFCRSSVENVTESLIGSVFNNYMVVDIIGHGGMAIVVKADRCDGAFSRRVAIKIINPLLIEPEFLERFRYECNLHASLTHPNIVQVFDSGVGEDEHPYIVMEYVEGVDLDDYVKSNELSLKERLLLFLGIADAVRYAHSRQIIHRDIKYSNILVTTQGTPKLLDFGIASKAEGTGTENEEAIGYSLKFASPEQIRKEEIDTRSDIYQLGTILEYVITERSVLDEFGETELVNTAESKTELPSIGKITKSKSNVSIKNFSQEELSAIVSKCRAPLTENRYQSVDTLIADINNLIDCRPVTAMNDSRMYPLSKFCRRQAKMLSLITIVFFAVITFTYFYVANISQAKFVALQESTKANQTLELLEAVFDTSDPFIASEGKGSPLAIAKSLEEKVKTTEYGEEIKSRLLINLAKAYLFSGKFEDAINTLYKIDKKQTKHYRESRYLIGFSLVKKGDFTNASAELEKLIDTLNDGRNLELKIKSMKLLVSCYLKVKDFQDSKSLASKAVALAEELNDVEVVIDAYLSYLEVLASDSSYAEETVSVSETLIELISNKFGSNNIRAASVYLLRANAQRTLENWPGAKQSLHRSLEIWNMYPGFSSVEKAETLVGLGRYYHRNGMTSRAQEYFHSALLEYESIYPDDSTKYIDVVSSVANSLWQQGKYESAFDKIAKILSQLESRPSSLLAGQEDELSRLYVRVASFNQELGNYEEALENYQNALAFKLSKYPDNSMNVLNIQSSIGVNLCLTGKIDDGKALLSDTNDKLPKSLGLNSHIYASLYSKIAICHYLDKSFQTARQYAEESIRIRNAIGNNSLYFYNAYTQLLLVKMALEEGSNPLAKLHLEKAESNYAEYKKHFPEHAIPYNELAIERSIMRIKFFKATNQKELVQTEQHNLRLIEEKVGLKSPKMLNALQQIGN